MNSAIIAASRLRQQVINPFANASIPFSFRDRGFGAINVFRVRRTGGATPTEQNFTFSEITDGTLTSWVGVGNDGFVAIWYNQKSANHATQTISTSQPQIVDNGNLIFDNLGNPCLLFDNDFLEIDPFYTASQSYVSFFNVYSLTDNGSFPAIIGSNPQDVGFLNLHNSTLRNIRTATIRTGGVSVYNGGALNLNETTLVYNSANRINIVSRINGVQTITGPDNNSDFVMPTKIYIGDTVGANNSKFKINEILGFTQEPDIVALETQIMNDYGI